MTAGSQASSSGLYAALTFHHARLEACGRHVLSMLSLEGPESAATSFGPWRRALDAQLEAEETFLLPRLERANPRTSQTIHDHHARLRTATDRVARSLEGLSSDERPLQELLDLLSQHCHREETELYRWAETAIDETDSRAVIHKIESGELGEK